LHLFREEEGTGKRPFTEYPFVLWTVAALPIRQLINENGTIAQTGECQAEKGGVPYRSDDGLKGEMGFHVEVVSCPRG
jgi:hypothetical protein